MMSDVTNVRRAEEALAEHRSPDPIDRATVHASLAISRAVRELDTTTRQVNRLVADSIDELAADLTASHAWPSFEPVGSVDVIRVNPLNVSHLVEDTPGTTLIVMNNGSSFEVDKTVEAVTSDMGAV